jgi:integrase
MAIAFIQKIEGKKGPIYKVHYTDPLTGKRRAKNHKRRKDAQAFLESPKINGEQDKKVPSVSEAVDHWLAVCENVGRKGREPVAKSTLRKYVSHAEYIKSAEVDYNGTHVCFGEILLSRLTKEHCEAFRAKLISDFSWQYARKHLVSLKSALDQARADSLMDHQPAEYVFIRPPARAPKYEIADDEKVPSLNEIKRILEQMRKRVYVSNKQLRRRRRRYKLVLETIALGGTRPGEALGLSWDDVLFDRGGIRITQDVNEDGTIGELKTQSAYRFIPMPDYYMRQLRWWKKLCPVSEYNLVFPNWSGKVEFLSNFNRRGWQPLLKDLKLVNEKGRSKYPPKSLRHARASLEIESGANPKEIKRLMGHSSIKVTFDVYGHLFEAHDDRRADRANAIANGLLYETHANM